MDIKKNLIKITDWLWEIPKSFRKDLRVPARIFTTEKMLEATLNDKSLEQLINVATLPGIQQEALVMPDVHEGYGFPIGGVAAFALENGIISPGGIGYDINCGVRLLRSNLTLGEIKPHLADLTQAINQAVPSGVGRGGKLKLNDQELDLVLEKGAVHLVAKGYGEPADLEHLESGGCLPDAKAELVSQHAKDRGRDQLGTLGAGNHFIEISRVAEIFDEKEAQRLNLFPEQIVILIHTGSRGLGHQIATDYIRLMLKVLPKYKISLPDRELVCAPFNSSEGQQYFSAMAAGANFAWANRQLITAAIRQAWQKSLGLAAGPLEIVYDVAHNIAKIEEHFLNGQKKKLIVHRKGATRSFPNQPVIIPGSMGTASYVLVGQEKALKESFGSTCHGAGRALSRHQAQKTVRGAEIKQKLNKQGIIIEAGSLSGLAEEAPQAYKNIDEVVEVVHQAGLAKKVAMLKPLAVIKG